MIYNCAFKQAENERFKTYNSRSFTLRDLISCRSSSSCNNSSRVKLSFSNMSFTGLYIVIDHVTGNVYTVEDGRRGEKGGESRLLMYKSCAIWLVLA